MSETVITPVIEEKGAWLEQRRKGIGGSDIAAICGLSPFSRPIDVWLSKTGRAPSQEESSAMHWGHNLEAIIADEYARVTGYKVEPGVHLEKGICVGNTDRMVPCANRILEVKTSSSFMAKHWGEPGTDEIPDYYLTQVQWYLGMLDPEEYNSADVPVLIGGNDFRIYHVERNQALINELVDIGESWWKKYVETDEPPACDGSLDDMKSRLVLHPKDDGSELVSNADIDALAHMLFSEREMLSQVQERVEALELKMKTLIGDASGIKGADWSVTWKASRDSKKVDWQAACLKAGVSQDIIDACTTMKSGSRRFLFKPKFS